MSAFTLVSHALCPYVQRAVIALHEKGVPYNRIDIDLGKKPAWFRALSPLGKVPVLRVETAGTPAALFESSVILEYLEDTVPPALHSADPLERARDRAWMAYADATLSGIGQVYSAPGEPELAEAASALAARFDRLETELGDGPWFAGARFGLVDAAFAPVFRYFETFEAIAAPPILAAHPKLARWRAALAARPSVRAAVDAGYPERLEAFILARNGALADRVRAQRAEEAGAG